MPSTYDSPQNRDQSLHPRTREHHRARRLIATGWVLIAVVVACAAYLYSSGGLDSGLIPGFILGLGGAGQVLRQGLKARRRL
jgi:hypothetical protein